MKEFKEHSPIILKVIKASTGKLYNCIYPYDRDGNLLSLNQIQQISQEVYDYLFEHKQELENRDIEDKNLWWSFGRTQGIIDTYKRKIAISNIIKNKESIKLNEVLSGEGVYNGLYILTNIDFDTIKNIIVSDDFVNYVKVLKKYKSGGYYTFNASDLEIYLKYFL